MIMKVFLDSDVILDAASGREPFVHDSKNVLNIIENGLAIGITSPNSITNIYYILTKVSSSSKARYFIKNLLEYVHVGIADHETILNASESKFYDFEDGVQHFCALRNQCDYLVTRNIKDYNCSEIKILEPKEFNLLFQK